MPWDSVVSVEWTFPKHVNIPRYSRDELLGSDEEEDGWHLIVEPCGDQREAHSCADRTGSTKAMRWECARYAQGAEKAAALRDGRERGTHGRGEAQIAQYPLDQGKDAGFVLSRMRAMDGCRSQKAHSSCCLEGRQGAGCAAG